MAKSIRPYKMTPEMVAVILEGLANGLVQRDRVVLAGIHEDTIVWNDQELVTKNRKSINALISGVKSIGLLPDMFGKEKTLVKKSLISIRSKSVLLCGQK